MASIEKREGKKGTSYRVQIKRRGMTTISATFSTHAEAKVWAATTEADIERGHISHIEAGKNMTLGAALELYKKQRTPAKKSAKTEGYLIDLMLKWDWASVPLSKLKREHFRQWRDYRRDTFKSSDATIKKDIKLINTVFNYMHDELGILGLVFEGGPIMKALESAEERDRRPTSEEWIKIIKHFDAVLPEFSIFIQVLRLTAMRRDELLYLTRRQVQTNGFVTLYETKNGYNRSFGLPPRALELLNSLPVRANGRFFGFERTTAASNWSRNMAKLEIVDLRMHDLRHDAISHFIEMGLAPNMVQIMSGHRSMNAMQRYINMRKETVYAEFMRLTELRGDMSGRYISNTPDVITIN